MSEIFLVFVGIQDVISFINLRVIDDVRVRKFFNDLKWCMYYEICVIYGLNVERVFQDVVQKIVVIRKKQQLFIGFCKLLFNFFSYFFVCFVQVFVVYISQISNGGGSLSDYFFFVLLIFSISQKEFWIDVFFIVNMFMFVCKQFKCWFNLFIFWKGSDLDKEKKGLESCVDSIGSG